jgi:hypothetical protein
MDTLASYEGSTEAGRMEGEGIYTYEDGTKYVGQFKNGAFHGECLCGNQISRRPTPSTRFCLRGCVCSMASSFSAVDATLSP